MHVGIAYLRWRGKHSRHSQRMRTRNFAYLARGPYITAVTEAEFEAGFEQPKDIPYLALTGELLRVFCSDFFFHKIGHVIMAPYCTIFLLISDPGRMLQMKTTSWVLIPELALRSYSYWPHGYGISKEVNGCNWNLEDRIIVTAVKMTKNYTVDENLLVVFLCQYLLHTLWYCWHCLYLSIITYINIYIYILHTPFNVDYLMHWIIHLHTNYYDTKIVSSWDDCNIYINMWILWLKCRS